MTTHHSLLMNVTATGIAPDSHRLPFSWRFWRQPITAGKCRGKGLEFDFVAATCLENYFDGSVSVVVT